jgi:hypothetical protein
MFERAASAIKLKENLPKKGLSCFVALGLIG